MIVNARLEPGGRRLRYEVEASGGLLGPYYAPYSGGDVLAAAQEHYLALGEQVYVAPRPDAEALERQSRERLMRAARDALYATDFVTLKATEKGLVLSSSWLAWREDLRRVLRGELNSIGAEPARYSEQPPAPAPVQPTEQEAVSVPPSEVQETPSGGGAAYAGTMLTEDRENYLRGVITVRVTQIERNRLEARYDANAQARQRWGFTEYHNASDLGLPITDEVRAAYQEFLVADQWVRATKDHADALRNAAITVGLPMLEAMQTSIEEGWP